MRLSAHLTEAERDQSNARPTITPDRRLSVAIALFLLAATAVGCRPPIDTATQYKTNSRGFEPEVSVVPDPGSATLIDLGSISADGGVSHESGTPTPKFHPWVVPHQSAKYFCKATTRSSQTCSTQRLTSILMAPPCLPKPIHAIPDPHLPAYALS